MTERLGWGVLGSGRRAREVMIPALLASPSATVVGVCGRDPAATAKALNNWPELKVFAEPRELLSQPELKVVYIATPHFLHVPQAVQALEADKHVFMEPPLALSVDGAHKLIEKAKTRGLKLGMAFPYRFHSALGLVKAKLSAGELGEIQHLRVCLAEPVEWTAKWWWDSFRSGPATLIRLGVPALDFAMWIKGSEIREVFALGQDSGDPPINSLVSILFSFQDHAHGFVLSASKCPELEHYLEIEGTSGRLELRGDFSGQGPVFLRELKGVEEKTTTFEPEDPVGVMLDAFTAAVNSSASYEPEGGAAKKIVEVACAVIESLKSRRLVKVGEVFRLSGAG